MSVSRRVRRAVLSLTLWAAGAIGEPSCAEVYWWCHRLPGLARWAPVAEVLDVCEGAG